MQVVAYECIIENGRVRLTTDIRLPENAKVYILIPNSEERRIVHIYSPRLAHPEQVMRFKKEVVEEPLDASL